MSLRENTKRLLKISTLIDQVTEKTGYGDTMVFVMIQDYLNSRIKEVDDKKIPLKIEDLKTKTANKKETIREKNIELEKLNKTYKSLIGELGGLKRSIANLMEKIKDQDTANYEFKEKKNKLTEEKNKKEEVFDLLQSDITKLRTDLQDLEEVIGQLEQQKRDLKKKLGEFKKEKAIVEYENAGARRKIYELNNEGEIKLINLLMWAATIVGILLAIYFVINKL